MCEELCIQNGRVRKTPRPYSLMSRPQQPISDSKRVCSSPRPISPPTETQEYSPEYSVRDITVRDTLSAILCPRLHQIIMADAAEALLAAGEAGPLEYLWRAVKVLFALSPMIIIGWLFVGAYDDDAAERKKRDAEFDFNLEGAGE